MYMENLNNKNFPEKTNWETPEKASDLELAIFLYKHIDSPCERQLPSGEVVNLRDFYIRQAREILPRMKNEYAKRLLEIKLKTYEDKL